MSKRFTIFALFAFSLMFLSFHAYANVLIEDTNTNSEIGSEPDFLMSGTIETGSGNAGDFVIFACSIANDFEVPFGPPTPDIWQELENTICPDFFCGLGIWAGFVTDADSEEITCNSIQPGVVVFVAGSMRYRNVDPDNPIIDVACDGGVGTVLTAPSIETEAGSQVLRVFTDGFLEDTFPGSAAVARAEIEDSWQVSVTSTFFLTLSASGFSRLQENAGPTGPSQLFVGSPRGWRACTIGIRMAPEPRAIPTLSEWGLLAMAGVIGIAGLIAVRKKYKLTA